MAKYLLLIFVISLQGLYAVSSDVVDIYRTKGILAVEKIIQKQLTTKKYWDDTLEDKDLSLGYFESIKYLIKCKKDLKDLVVYDTNTNKEIMRSKVIVGKIAGDKQIEGDLKTPIGAYSLIQRLEKIDPFYGPLALATNYPNIYDKSQGKTGHGIWIHGVPVDQKRDVFTKGCIALKNINLIKLDKNIDLKNTILQIYPKKSVKTNNDEIAILLSSLYSWKSAWVNGDIKTYLSFYDNSFKKPNGQDIVSFSKYKKRIFKKNEKKIIKFTKINIIPYPNIKKQRIFKIVMKEYYKTSNIKFEGIKAIYVEIKNNKFSILTES